MAFSTEEIKANLTEFSGRWAVRPGYEKGEAQTFLNEFFGCFGSEIADGASFEDFDGTGFKDCTVSDIAIIEMKSASEAKKLEKHEDQLFGYWEKAAETEDGAPRFLMLCAFTRFMLWEPGVHAKKPVLDIELGGLADHFAAFSFLLGKDPIFSARDEEVTVEAVTELVKLLTSLEERDEGTSGERRSFILQCVWCMFAEDTGQINDLGFTRILDGLLADSNRSSADEIGGLFGCLNDSDENRPKHGMYATVPYVNGSLFAEPARLHLESEELRILRKTSDFDWSKIRPAVFGSLMQSVFGPDRQHQLGAHYTPEAEIQLVVEPTILRPWRERIEAAETFDEADQALRDLHAYRVLDPACGCGNFLSVAYREIRRVERLLLDRMDELAKHEGRPEGAKRDSYFPLSNMLGIEIESFAVDLARLSLWMAQWLAGKELDLPERTLPLADLDGIKRADALRVEWPVVEAIVSNPPYHGSQNLRKELAPEQVEFLKSEFSCGLKDYCVYWFRCAAEKMRPGDRAGMVGTNSISQNRARVASLNYVVKHGGVITDAVSRHKWPGEAVVNVSIVNWVKNPDAPTDEYRLDGQPVVGINTRLQESIIPIEEYEPLAANAGKAFQGPIPAGPFDLTLDEAKALLAADAKYAQVVRPYLIGDDIAKDPAQAPRRYIIDFNRLPLETAADYPDALDLVRQRVKPKRDENKDAGFRKFWWQFGRPRGEMRKAIAGLDRYIAANAQGKRFLFVWADKKVCPSNLTNVFAFNGDYEMGILSSSTHGVWAMSEGSTLEDRPRYTPTSCFETFPWPMPTKRQRDEIGGLSVELLGRRSEICTEKQIGLTTLYNQVDEGAWQDLAAAHRKLDVAVVKAYGWPAKVAHDPLEMKARLAKRHAGIMEDPDSYKPF